MHKNKENEDVRVLRAADINSAIYLLNAVSEIILDEWVP